MKSKKSHYDGYDYPKYWDERSYEHDCEVYAISEMIKKSNKRIDYIVDIGCGFGRLLPAYYNKKSKITLVDPSQDLLDIASIKNAELNNISYKKGEITDLKKLGKNKYDLALVVRVLHHVEDLDSAFKQIHKLLKPGGLLILEYANKMHGKDQIRNFAQGNITFPLEIFPVDKRSEKNKKIRSIPFLNFHPDDVEDKLKKLNFNIIEKRSVSNFRSRHLKKFIGENNLVEFEKYIQKPLSRLHFGPSIFILASKV